MVSSIIVLALLFNLAAYNQAHSMLNFRPIGKPRKDLESLTLLEKIWVLLAGIQLPKPLNDERPDDHNMGFEVHWVQSADLKLEAWYIPVIDSKGTVLLFHGYGGSKAGVLGEAKAFHNLGYSTFLVDLRGSGGSEGGSTTIGFLEGGDVAASYRYVVQSLVMQNPVTQNPVTQSPVTQNPVTQNLTPMGIADKHPIYLYGRSMGAASILRALATTDIAPDAIILDAVFAEMVTAVKNRFRSIGVPSVPAAHALIFWASIQNGFSGFRHNPVKYASSVTVPTLVMHGAADRLATLDEGERVFNAIGATKKHFIPFEDLGHEPYLPAQPERWLGAVQNFLMV